MICVRAEGKAACQVTFMAVLVIINLFIDHFLLCKQNTKITLMLLLHFYRVTLEDLCSASRIQCGFKLALLFLGNVVTVVIPLKSIPECLSFRGGLRMKCHGIAWALKCSPPTIPTLTTVLCVQIPQQQLLHTPGCFLSSQWQCTWRTVWLYSSFSNLSYSPVVPFMHDVLSAAALSHGIRPTLHHCLIN